jgi:two-component system sensor histidine kinase/response regulator
MLTSANYKGDLVRAGELAVNGHLLKPVRESQLRQVLSEVLSEVSSQALQETERVSATPAPDDQVPHDTLQLLRVLVAEDNRVNQRVAVRLLERRGHQVVIAENGQQAIAELEQAAIRKQHYDLVLMDVQMPVMDGLEATAWIREHEIASDWHQPVIALTAHAMKGDEERFLAAGMDGYLAKPIHSQELDRVLGLVAKIAHPPPALQGSSP